MFEQRIPWIPGLTCWLLCLRRAVACSGVTNNVLRNAQAQQLPAKQLPNKTRGTGILPILGSSYTALCISDEYLTNAHTKTIFNPTTNCWKKGTIHPRTDHEGTGAVDVQL